jgi:hypothetical protein
MRDVHVVPFWNAEIASLSIASGSSVSVLGEAPYLLAKALPRLLFAVAQLPLLAGAHVGALEVPNECPTIDGENPST